MGTILITRSTPRITYRMGTRARFGDEEDESLPGRTSEAPSIEVAADFTGIYRILMSRDGIREKTVSSAITKVPAEMTVPHGFGKKRLRGRRQLRTQYFTLAATRHQIVNRFAGIFPLMQDGVDLLGNRHLNSVPLRQSDCGVCSEDSLRDHTVHSG